MRWLAVAVIVAVMVAGIVIVATAFTTKGFVAQPGWSASACGSIERSKPATANRARVRMNGSPSCTGGRRRGNDGRAAPPPSDV